MRRLRSSLLLLILLCVGHAAQATTQFKMITLQYRFAQDVLPIVESMVGPEGKVSALDNHLMITATPEQLTAIEQVLAKLDVARKTMRITVSHDDMLDSDSAAVGARAQGRVGDVTVGVGAPRPSRGNGVDVGVDQRNSRYSVTGSQFVSVTEGEQAFIRVGQSVPYTQQWISITQRHTHIQQGTQFQDITTGFAVRPRAIGQEVELQIMPRIARPGAGGIVDFQELQTTVRVAPGTWFDLGGTMEARDEVSRTILNQRSSSGVRSQKLMIRVD
jgi:type II secretory pathway component GspD/PulD (secretin)